MRLIIALVFILGAITFCAEVSPNLYMFGQDSVAMAAGDEGGTPSKGKVFSLDFTKVLDKYGIIIAIFLSFMWGIVAGVASPCVFPLVPITVAYFATQGEAKGRGYTILLAWVYVLGIATLFTPLGVIFARAGKNVGALLGNPLFIGPFVAFLVAMALSMFGFFEIKLPDFIMRRLHGGERKTGVVGTFVLGIILGMVAMPCVGPFLASILGFVGTKGSIPIGATALFFFSLGLGMPYLALAISAKALAGMPKAGEWMIRVKQFAGMVILLVAVYFLSKVMSFDIVKILGGIIVVVMGIFLSNLMWHQVSVKYIAGRAIGILLAVGGVVLFSWGVLGLIGLSERVPGLRPAGPVEEIRWVTNFEEGMKLAKETGKPVFIDFYASWCTDCKLMEARTWTNKDVVKEAKRFVAIKLDCSKDDSPYNKLRMERFKSFAMPVTVFFDSKGNYLEDLSSEGYTGPEKFLKTARGIK